MIDDAPMPRPPRNPTGGEGDRALRAEIAVTNGSSGAKHVPADAALRFASVLAMPAPILLSAPVTIARLPSSNSLSPVIVFSTLTIRALA
jgi:hypothetical protein